MLELEIKKFKIKISILSWNLRNNSFVTTRCDTNKRDWPCPTKCDMQFHFKFKRINDRVGNNIRITFGNNKRYASCLDLLSTYLRLRTSGSFVNDENIF